VIVTDTPGNALHRELAASDFLAPRRTVSACAAGAERAADERLVLEESGIAWGAVQPLRLAGRRAGGVPRTRQLAGWPTPDRAWARGWRASPPPTRDWGCGLQPDAVPDAAGELRRRGDRGCCRASPPPAPGNSDAAYMQLLLAEVRQVHPRRHAADPRRTPAMSTTRDTLPSSMYALLVALTLIWGFNWTVIKVVVTEVPPWFFRSLCFLSAFVGLLAVARARGLPLMPQGASNWRRITAVALCTVSLQNIFLMLRSRCCPRDGGDPALRCRPGACCSRVSCSTGADAAPPGAGLGIGRRGRAARQGPAGLGRSRHGARRRRPGHTDGGGGHWALGVVLQKR
jgi:hypothetical protein